MKSMLKYYFKNRYILLIILSVIVLTITLVDLTQRSFVIERWIDGIVTGEKWAEDAPTMTLTIFSCVLATIVPLYEFYYKHRKVNVDQFYSLPIKKEKLYASTFIFGYIEILIPLTLSFLATLIYVGCSYHLFYLGYYVIYYLIILIFALCLYAIITFVYCQNNNFIDGLVNVIISIFIGAIVFVGCVELFKIKYSNSLGINNFDLFIYSPLIILEGIFEDLMERGFVDFYDKNLIGVCILFASFIILAIVCFILFIHHAKNENGENSMQISESYFSYKTMLPILIICSMVGLNESLGVALFIVLICSYLAYCLYKRTFRLKKKEIITLCVVDSIAIILAFLANTVI